MSDFSVALCCFEVPKDSGGEDVNTVSAGMGRWLAAVQVKLSREPSAAGFKCKKISKKTMMTDDDK